jgi:type III pantothenate kinase
MLLLIDAGNTRVKWALADVATTIPSHWLADGAVAHADLTQLPDDWAAALTRHAPAGALTGALISNVAGPAMGATLASLLGACGLTPQAIRWFASLPQLAGVRNGYRNPAQLGCDRFAAAIGARALAPNRALIVATCGTATTIDAIDADGLFIGGMILPGLGLMAAALARNTAQLPQVLEGAPAPAALVTFADNTDDAIRSGCLAAQAGAIERACAIHGAALCLVSGGAGPAIAAALAPTVARQVIDNIVLAGLYHAALAERGNEPC